MALTCQIFQRGEDIQIPLFCSQGDPGNVTSITAKMRKLAQGKRDLDGTEPVAATFAVEAFAAEGDVPPGWLLSISDEDSLGLTTGSYLADALLVIGTGKVITDPVRIEIKESASL